MRCGTRRASVWVGKVRWATNPTAGGGAGVKGVCRPAHLGGGAEAGRGRTSPSALRGGSVHIDEHGFDAKFMNAIVVAKVG